MHGLQFFSRTNSKRCWTLAAFHSPHSLTWSWVLSLSVMRWDEGRWAYFAPYRTNGGLQWLLMLWPVNVQWHRQQPMWYRDLYHRARDERDGLLDIKKENDIRPSARDFVPTVIDGGLSLH